MAVIDFSVTLITKDDSPVWKLAQQAINQGLIHAVGDASGGEKKRQIGEFHVSLRQKTQQKCDDRNDVFGLVSNA